MRSAPAADSVVPAVAASPGMAIAPCWVMRLPRFVYETRSDAGADREAERLVASIQTAREQLLALVNRAEGAEMAEILSMHEEMLGDPELFAGASRGGLVSAFILFVALFCYLICIFLALSDVLSTF